MGSRYARTPNGTRDSDYDRRMSFGGAFHAMLKWRWDRQIDSAGYSVQLQAMALPAEREALYQVGLSVFCPSRYGFNPADLKFMGRMQFEIRSRDKVQTWWGRSLPGMVKALNKGMRTSAGRGRSARDRLVVILTGLVLTI